jgi:Uma2 family endonuclease
MSNLDRNLYMTVDEYLASEELASVRHEYVDGQVFAMTGATRRHNIIAGNIHSLLRAHIKGGPCRVYISDVKVRVETANCFYYPDVMVSCDRFDAKSVFTGNPTLLVEVLSPSTSSIDRREKLTAYKLIASLKEYVIVHQKTKRVQIYRKDSSELWHVSDVTAGEDFIITSIPGSTLTVNIDEIYADVDGGEIDESGFEVCEEASSDLLEAGDLVW